jgi:hypothetical protein
MRRLMLAASMAAILSTSATAQPVVYVWRLECVNGLAFGPYSTPETCAETRRSVNLACERPTLVDYDLGKNGRLVKKVMPNPDFVRVADVCKDAHNGRDCACEYVVMIAKPTPLPPGHRSIGDMIREIDAARAAAPTGPIKVGP